MARLPPLSLPPTQQQQAVIEETAPDKIRTLAALVNGCRDDPDGTNAKKSLVMAFVASGGENLLDVLLWLQTTAFRARPPLQSGGGGGGGGAAANARQAHRQQIREEIRTLKRRAAAEVVAPAAAPAVEVRL